MAIGYSRVQALLGDVGDGVLLLDSDDEHRCFNDCHKLIFTDVRGCARSVHDQALVVTSGRRCSTLSALHRARTSVPSISSMSNT